MTIAMLDVDVEQLIHNLSPDLHEEQPREQNIAGILLLGAWVGDCTHLSQAVIPPNREPSDTATEKLSLLCF